MDVPSLPVAVTSTPSTVHLERPTLPRTIVGVVVASISAIGIAGVAAEIRNVGGGGRIFLALWCLVALGFLIAGVSLIGGAREATVTEREIRVRETLFGFTTDGERHSLGPNPRFYVLERRGQKSTSHDVKIALDRADAPDVRLQSTASAKEAQRLVDELTALLVRVLPRV